MMFLKTAFIAAFIPALSLASECADNPAFTFNLESNNFVQRCSWITRNKDKIDNRRNKYCSRGEIAGGCPLSCDMCPCADDLSFEFTLKFSGASEKCSWLVEKHADKRLKNYCPVQEIGSACVNTCGFCTGEGGTPAPSGVPSTSPSVAPTGDPTALPSSTPSISMTPTDLSTAQPSVSMGPTISGTMRPSSSHSSKPSARPSINGSMRPSTSPTSKPSARPSISPTSKPSGTPSINGTMRPSTSPSNAPTDRPSEPPTMSPIVGCADDPIFTFKIDKGITQKCSWLLKNKQESRFKNYCDRGHVKTACKNSCQYCTCKNTEDYSFTIGNGSTKTCRWFTRNTLHSIKRQHKYCFEEDNKLAASEIGSNCVESCGFCNGFSA